MQCKGIVHLHQFGHLVLLETDETLQIGGMLPCAAHAVYYVALFLLPNEKYVEHFNLLWAKK